MLAEGDHYVFQHQLCCETSRSVSPPPEEEEAGIQQELHDVFFFFSVGLALQPCPCRV